MRARVRGFGRFRPNPAVRFGELLSADGELFANSYLLKRRRGNPFLCGRGF